MRVAITGHRPNKLDNDYDLKSPLILKIKEQIQDKLRDITWGFEKPLTLITGMALGIDTLFALIAIEYKLPFIAAVPCKAQWAKWIKKSRELYHRILSDDLCAIHMVTDDYYTNDCMQKRNEWMVDNSDVLIAVWDKSAGGTANCVKYAKKKDKIIYYINPDDFR